MKMLRVTNLSLNKYKKIKPRRTKKERMKSKALLVVLLRHGLALVLELPNQMKRKFILKHANTVDPNSTQTKAKQDMMENKPILVIIQAQTNMVSRLKEKRNKQGQCGPSKTKEETS